MSYPSAATAPADRPLPQFAYDSAGAAPGEAFAVWREMFSPQVDAESVGPRRSFQASLEFWNLGDVVFHTARYSAIRLDRTRRHVATGPFDGVTLQLLLEGSESIRAGDSEVEAGSGQVMLTDWSQPRTSMTTDAASLLVAIPRGRIRGSERLFAAAANLSIECSSPEGRLIAETLTGLRASVPRMAHGEARQLSDELLGLVNDVIDVRLAGDAFDPTRQPVTLPVMQGWLTKRLATRGLGVESLTRAFHMSRASIYRLFKPCGGVSRFIREQRLQAIARELVTGVQQPVGIEEVARRWGYDDTKYFYRVFKQHFGCTPTEARQAAEFELPSTPPADDSAHPLAHRLYGWLDTGG